MKKSIFILFLICITSRLVYSQSRSNYWQQNIFDVAVSGSKGNLSAALSAYHLHSFGSKKQKLKIGYGLRLTSFIGANKYYTTAPSKYTSDVQTIGTIFSKNIDKNIDTLTTATTSTNSINFVIHLEYEIISKLAFGFNIDAIGFSFGPEKQFDILSSSFDPNQAPVQKGAPTKFNLLLTSDNDIGSLNSEFYLRYWITNKIGVRAGYTFLFSEYQTYENLSFDNKRIVNDRYRYKASLAMLAICFRPFYKN